MGATMQDRDLTKAEAAALLGSKDATGKAIDRLVNDGLLTRYERPRIGKRYLESEVLALRTGGQLKPEQRPEQQKQGSDDPDTHQRDHHASILFSSPDPEFDPEGTANMLNAVWSDCGMDAMLRNTRKSGEPATEWPALVATPFHGAAKPSVMVRWDTRSGMTPAFVKAFLARDTEAAMDELRRMLPDGERQMREKYSATSTR